MDKAAEVNRGPTKLYSVERNGKNFRTEVDPETGVRSEFYDNGDGSITIKQHQDLEDHVNYAKECRNNGGATDIGEKDGVRLEHYAIIPAVVQHEMYTKGIDLSRDGKAVFDYINRFYPALKLTDKWHDSEKAKKNPKIIVK